MIDQIISKWWQRTFSVGLILYLLAGHVAWADTTGDKEEQDQRARQETEQREQRQQQKDVFLQQGSKETEETSLPQETNSFEIHKLELEGKDVTQFPWAQKMLAKYTGRKIGIKGIDVIVKRMTNAFIDRGYITTRVVVPEQNLSTGTLKLILIPGKIGIIRFAEKSIQGNWKTAFPARSGEILNLRQLEQGLEQMKRLPSRDVDMQLVPGKNPGESDVVITVKETDPYKFVFSIDDSGTQATGKIQTSEALSLYDLFAINDIFTITQNSDGDRAGSIRGTQGDSVYFSVPYGDSTFSFTSNRYQYHQTVYGDMQPFDSSGKTSSMEFHLTQLLHRDKVSKTNLELGIIKEHIRSYIEDTEIEDQNQDTTAFKLGISRRQYFGQATLDIEIDNKRGVPWFGAMGDSLAATGEDDRYKMWIMDTNLTTPVILGSVKGNYRFTFHGQYSRDVLYETDMISIGNRYTVRGFDGEENLSGESGWYIQNELAVPVPDGFQIYTGLDYGAVYGEYAQNLLGRILAGAVVGVRAGTNKVSYDLFVGWPLREPAGFVTGNPTYGFQLTCQI